MNASIHYQATWDSELEDDLRRLVRLAIRADLDRGCDLTSVALLDDVQSGAAAVVARRGGIVCGLEGIAPLLAEFHTQLRWQAELSDGAQVAPGRVLGRLDGNGRDLLAVERTLLNYLSYLSGIATITREFTTAVADSSAVICETRKAIPGWLRLAKYAAKCGGATNHRRGLYDAVLIKDNHLAAFAAARGEPAGGAELAGEALRQAKQAVHELAGGLGTPTNIPVEIEVDTLEQLATVLPEEPDIVLLDNFNTAMLRQAVELRDKIRPTVLLEASGGITIDTVGEVADTGVDRISVGFLTHSAPALDLAMDWEWETTES